MDKHQVQYQTVRFTLNGKEVEKTVDVRASLTDMLRNDFRMQSVKKGCEVGECGACTVIIDGETLNSCLYLAVWAEGKNIRTLESLVGPNGELSDIQQAFVEEAAIQCGFCTPGFIMTAQEIIETGKEYTDDELRKLLSGHLCRCTGYENVLRAVKKAIKKKKSPKKIKITLKKIKAFISKVSLALFIRSAWVLISISLYFSFSSATWEMMPTRRLPSVRPARAA